MKNLCVCLFAVSLAVSAALAASGTFAPSAWAQKPPLASISVETGKLGVQIPEDFVGISLEVSAAGQGVAPFAKPGAAKQGPAPQLAAPARVPQYALGRGGEPNDIFFQFLRNLASCGSAGTARTTPAGSRRPLRIPIGAKAKSLPRTSASIRKPQKVPDGASSSA